MRIARSLSCSASGVASVREWACGRLVPMMALAAGTLLASAPLVQADETVRPNGYDATNGTATFLGPLSNAQRTYQLLIHADQLTALQGRNITGIAFRSTSGSTTAWPTADVEFASWELRLGPSVDPSARSLTDFSANVVGGSAALTLVRSGPLRIDALSYGINVPSPHPFGPTITLTPYTYSGGNLMIEIRHTGFSGTSRSVDAIGTSTAGYGTQFSACWQSNAAANSGPQGNFAVIKLTTEVGGGGGGCNLADITEVGGTEENPGNPDQQLTVDDLILFVNLFSSGTGCPGAVPCNRADVTGIGGNGAAPDGELTVDDLIEFVNAFSTGC